MMNFREYDSDEIKRGNHRLREKSVPCVARITKFDETGKILEIQETTTREINDQRMRSRGPRKQTAAKCHIPVESIRVVPPPAEPRDPYFVHRVLEGEDPAVVRIDELEEKIALLEGEVS